MKVAIVMGSNSDYPIMKNAEEILQKFEIEYESKVVSAHRTPEAMFEFARTAYDNGFNVIIAGAGGAAHLPGMVASITALPVIGVPIKLKSLEGLDSLLSIVQMPSGVPVATMGINQAANAALLAVQILASANQDLYQKLLAYKEELKAKVAAMELE